MFAGFPRAYLSGGFKGFSASSIGLCTGFAGAYFWRLSGLYRVARFRGLQGFRAHVLERVSLGES